jgi:hypothetical protein
MAVSNYAQHRQFLMSVQDKIDFWGGALLIGTILELPAIASLFMTLPGFILLPFGIVAPVVIVTSIVKMVKYSRLKTRAINYLTTQQSSAAPAQTARMHPVAQQVPAEPELILYEKFPAPVNQRKALNVLL